MKRKIEKQILKAASFLLLTIIIANTVTSQNVVTNEMKDEKRQMKEIFSKEESLINRYLVFGFGDINWAEFEGERRGISDRVKSANVTISNSIGAYGIFEYRLGVIDLKTLKFYSKEELPEPCTFKNFNGYIGIMITPPPDNIRLPKRYTFRIRGFAEGFV